MKTFESILDIIRQGGDVDPDELLPHLADVNRSTRFIYNDYLARTYYYAGKPDRAVVFADRALLLLTGYSESFINFYVLLHRALGNIEAVQNAYKAVGMERADAGDVLSALKYFNQSRDAYADAGLGDRYEYDFDILKKIETLAYSSPQRSVGTPSSIFMVPANKKIRLAYLVYGAKHSQSVLIKILCDFARLHDQVRYEVAFFVPDSNIDYGGQVSVNVEKLRKAGGRVIEAGSASELDCLYKTAQHINEFSPHILVTTAVLTDYAQYFISMLVSVSVRIGLCYGPPAQYIAPTLDWVISPSIHPLLDSPCNGSLVNLEQELPSCAMVSAYSRQDLVIPPDSVVILSAGRPAKFQNREFWKAIVNILEVYPQAFFVAVGLAEPPPFLAELMHPSLQTRFLNVGWRDDYLNILATADIVVDTFPSGGAVTVLDAMGLAIPVVSFHNDYLKVFDQNDWNPAGELIRIPELLAARGRFDEWLAILSSLVEGKEFRQLRGRQCQEMAAQMSGSPERMIANHEQIYENVLYEKVLTNNASKPASWKIPYAQVMKNGALTKVLQVNGYESPGRRFNGLSITPLLKTYGIESRHLVWEKDTQNPEVLTFEGAWARRINRVAKRVEDVTSLQSVLYPHAAQMMKMPAFKEADVLHLHIIHSGYLSLSDLPKITKRKPTVWTLHDPWAMTGHCVYPFECKRWMTGCGSCPDLGVHFPLRMDTTRLLFRYKRWAYRNSKFDVIVASKWMRDMVEASPAFEHIDIHQVPFGLDLNFFSPVASPNARKRFGIPDDALVICFRAVGNEFKGLPYIIQALERISSKQPVCLLTLNTKGLLERFAGRFQLVELGWSNDEALTRDAFVATDIFLMPSIVEAFGVMAIEAMACGKPVIVFEGTALPEVTFAPDVGLSVPMRDTEALFQALQRLIDNPAERKERGRKGRMIAELHYGDDMYARRLAKIYRMVAAK